MTDIEIANKSVADLFRALMASTGANPPYGECSLCGDDVQDTDAEVIRHFRGFCMAGMRAVEREARAVLKEGVLDGKHGAILKLALECVDANRGRRPK